MITRPRTNEKGFTLVETTMSIMASTILLLTVLSLVNITQNEWKKGDSLQYLTHELDFAIKNISQEVHASSINSVAISAWGDTLKLDADRSLYKDADNNLVFKRGTVTFPYLEEIVESFYVDSPVVLASGDTVNSVGITLVVKKDRAKDSTWVLITPREQE